MINMITTKWSCKSDMLGLQVRWGIDVLGRRIEKNTGEWSYHILGPMDALWFQMGSKVVG